MHAFLPIASTSRSTNSEFSSFPAVWSYILPALDHIMKSPTDGTHPPVLDVKYHMGVYTVVYNFATASRTEKPGNRFAAHGYNFGFTSEDDEEDIADEERDWEAGKMDRVKSMVGWELYNKLDEYFRTVARDVRENAPADDADLLDYYLKSWTRYNTGVGIVHRLFAYLNRHFITRAADEGVGWLCLADVLKRQRRKAKKGTMKDIEKLEQRKKEELKKWGFDGGTEDQRKAAEACAEAASGLDRIVGVGSMARRRWRLEVVEPFLGSAVPPLEIALDEVKEKVEGEEEKDGTPSSPLSHTADSSTTLAVSEGETTIATTSTKPHAKRKKKNKSSAVKQNGIHPSPNSLAVTPIAPPPPSTPLPPPKGRLNRAIGTLITGRGDMTKRKEIALKLSKSLKSCGVPRDELIRKRIDKFTKG
jgi:hypothetical protein